MRKKTVHPLCNGNLGVPCKQNERQALLMFEQDLKDPSNRLLSWVCEGDCCNWTGVVCDNFTGHVRELHLGNYYSDELQFVSRKLFGWQDSKVRWNNSASIGKSLESTLSRTPE
ncbi:hypothetical protein L3X38_016171 [Prunus dulcis]|uniref:Leucine-rich repeat-containing N-terminal plant-type domain-containing protein n=1 Tax=Prunus dulcis TaxID=3755 RepID=A0AAD4W7H2_PRUDU|nr:hypothetical protein L3X38_016171 [Prunus dulcis]